MVPRLHLRQPEGRVLHQARHHRHEAGFDPSTRRLAHLADSTLRYEPKRVWRNDGTRSSRSCGRPRPRTQWDGRASPSPTTTATGTSTFTWQTRQDSAFFRTTLGARTTGSRSTCKGRTATGTPLAPGDGGSRAPPDPRGGGGQRKPQPVPYRSLRPGSAEGQSNASRSVAHRYVEALEKVAPDQILEVTRRHPGFLEEAAVQGSRDRAYKLAIEKEKSWPRPPGLPRPKSPWTGARSASRRST